MVWIFPYSNASKYQSRNLSSSQDSVSLLWNGLPMKTMDTNHRSELFMIANCVSGERWGHVSRFGHIRWQASG